MENEFTWYILVAVAVAEAVAEAVAVSEAVAVAAVEAFAAISCQQVDFFLATFFLCFNIC